MPDIVIINDNASFTTSTSSSSSSPSTLRHTTTHNINTNTNTITDTQPSFHPHPSLRRKPSTVQRLSTWVTKKISKPRLRTGTGNDALHSPTQVYGYGYGSLEDGGYAGDTVAATAAVREDTGTDEYAYEDAYEDHDDEKLYESYAAFCDAFTSSGMGVDAEMKARKKERKKKMVIQAYIQPNSTSVLSRTPMAISTSTSTSSSPSTSPPTSSTYTPDKTSEMASVSRERMQHEISPVDSGCYSSSSSSFSFERSREKERRCWALETEDVNPGYCYSPSNCPAPPPEVLTPALYAQMSRDSRQTRKSKRRWYFCGSAVRLWFSCGRSETNPRG